MQVSIQKVPLVIMLSTIFYCNQSFAILPIVYDPYDVVQNSITAKNSVESLINQAKQLQFELDNLKKLSKGKDINTLNVLNQLSDITSQGQSLSYGVKHIDEVFKQKFPGLTASHDYSKDYSNWSGVTYETLKNSMMALSLQGKLFKEEDDDMKALQALSDQSEGNLEAQQTSHRISLHEISQVQKLRQLLLTQASSQNTFMAYQLQKEQAQQAAVNEWVKNSQVAFHKYDDAKGFGVNDMPKP